MKKLFILVLALFATPAIAQDTASAPAKNAASPSAKGGNVITPDRAREIALAQVHGEVTDIDFEYANNGASYYEVDVRDGMKEHELHIDAKTGKVLRVKTEIDD